MRRKDFLASVKKESRRIEVSRRNGKGLWHYVVTATSIGWVLVLPALGGVYLGRWLDRWSGMSGFWTLSLMFAGLAGGIFWVWYTNFRRGGGRG